MLEHFTDIISSRLIYQHKFSCSKAPQWSHLQVHLSINNDGQCTARIIRHLTHDMILLKTIHNELLPNILKRFVIQPGEYPNTL